LTLYTDWHERGGLVGRGVLLDYKAYADEKGIKYSPFEAHAISVKDLEAVAEHQGTTFKQGDILIVRSGFTGALTPMSADEQDKALGTHKTVGVEGNEEAAKWIWNKHFAAVAGDAIAFEVIPPVAKKGFIKEGKERKDGETGDVGDLGTCLSIVMDLAVSDAVALEYRRCCRCDMLTPWYYSAPPVLPQSFRHADW